MAGFGRTERDWVTLCSEYNLCKRKLQTKKEALLILAQDLEGCMKERDQYKLILKKFLEACQCAAVKTFSFEQDGSNSPHSSRSRNKNEEAEENEALRSEVRELRQNLTEAQGDIKLLRENMARQRLGDETGSRHFAAHEREDLVSCLEKTQEECLRLERELKDLQDEREEIASERVHYRDKSDRLNTQLSYLLQGDERKIVDIDALVTENKYWKERFQQSQEEKNHLNATVNKYKTALERKRNRNALKIGGNRGTGGVVSSKQVQQFLAEGRTTGLPVTQATLNDLQSLSMALFETVNDKNMALAHQKNTNKILGTRVAELEKKLKTLEVSGLWNVPKHNGKLEEFLKNGFNSSSENLIVSSTSTEHAGNKEHHEQTLIDTISPRPSEAATATVTQPEPDQFIRMNLDFTDTAKSPDTELRITDACASSNASPLLNVDIRVPSPVQKLYQSEEAESNALCAAVGQLNEAAAILSGFDSPDGDDGCNLSPVLSPINSTPNSPISLPSRPSIGNDNNHVSLDDDDTVSEPLLISDDVISSTQHDWMKPTGVNEDSNQLSEIILQKILRDVTDRVTSSAVSNNNDEGENNTDNSSML